MIAVVIRNGHAYCGRPGCDARAFGDLVALGAGAGGRTAWWLKLTRRWLWRPDLTPMRWRRAGHSRTHGERANEVPQGRGWEYLPVNIECPRCHAVQLVEPPP